MEIIRYMAENVNLIISLTVDHVVLFFIAIALATFAGLVLGILTIKSNKFAFLLPIINSLQAAPELVLLALAILFFGLGVQAALAALFVKGVLPILRNTYSGIGNIDETIVEAARGMGMRSSQILLQIELPLALPVILSGVRVASVMAVSTLTLAAYIGVSGLGVLITQGIAMSDTNALLTGSVLAAFLAIAANYVILFIEKQLTARRT